MARPKKQLNRRSDILGAAQKLFIEKGIEKTTLNEIAQSIGISKASIYLDFKNKEEIFLAIIEQHFIKMIEQREKDVEEANPPYIKAFEEILNQEPLRAFDMALSHVYTHYALVQTSYKIRQDLAHLIQRKNKITASLLEKAAANGEIDNFDDYEKLAQLICVCLQGFFPPYDLKYSLEHRTDLNKEEIRSLLFNDASIVINIILSGLKSKLMSDKFINLVKDR